MAQTLYFSLLFIALCSLSECIQRQYYYINMTMTWNEAQEYCTENYTDLATVHNMKEMDQMLKSVNVNNVNFWIGLKNTTVYEWKWSLGDPLTYKNWKNGQPNDQNKCATMKNGTWHSQACDKKLSFICYNESSGEYIYETSNKTWNEAQGFCRRNHTDLASVRNLTENQQIVNIINANQISVWIGLFMDLWEWSDKSDSGFRNWKQKEPNGGDSLQCTEVQMAHQGQWNDVACSYNQTTFVCHEDKLILIKESRSWLEALMYCRENHMDLLSVDSEVIQKRLTAVLRHASTTEVWLGLRHSCSVDLWFWVSGEILCYENWASRNEAAVDDCGTAVRSGAVCREDHRWISLPETKELNFICSRY